MLLAVVAVYEWSLENVACSSSGEDGADEEVDVAEKDSNSSCVYEGFVLLSEKGIGEDFREARSVWEEDCSGLEEKCEAP